MSENLRRYTKAVYGFDAVARRVAGGAWENQSPCSEWKAIDVVGHSVGVGMLVRVCAAGGDPMAGGARPTTRMLAGEDPFASWASGRDAVLEALDQPDVLTMVATTPFGPMPMDTFLGIMTVDVFTHAWDLARAAEVEPHIDESLAAICLETVKPMDAMLRGPGRFDPAKPAPANASAVESLISFLGRTV